MTELVRLPADVISGSMVADPTGRWLTLLAYAAAAPGGHSVLNLCGLELHTDGAFRDVADLGSAERAPSAARIAWAPGADGTPIAWCSWRRCPLRRRVAAA